MYNHYFHNVQSIIFCPNILFYENIVYRTLIHYQFLTEVYTQLLYVDVSYMLMILLSDQGFILMK